MPEMKENKILVLIPSPKKAGGQASYWRVLSKYLRGKIRCFVRGRRGEGVFFRLSSPFILLYDYFRFFIICLGKVSLIHINSTFSPAAVLRDSAFMLISGITGKRVLLSYHGWNKMFEKHIEKGMAGRIYRRLFFYSSSITAMTESAGIKLKEWGYRGKIIKESTFADDALIGEFSENDIHRRFNNEDDCLKMLFLSRIERQKGIFEAVDAYAILKKRHDKILLSVAGEGSMLGRLRRYIKSMHYEGIVIEGNVEGEAKRRLFAQSDIFILPTCMDSMPIAMVEAIAFGLPVITNDVGGIPDFFIQGRMGYMAKGGSAGEIAELAEKLINDREKRKEISIFNYHHARRNLYASGAGKRLDKLYRLIIQGENDE